MNKSQIIDTAFRVWGRDFYRKPSLSSLAKGLKVSKPALYRHFLSKNALNKAMLEHFYDDFAASIKLDFEKALQMEDPDEGIFTIIQAISNYFAHNCYSLIFSLMNISDRKIDRKSAADEIRARGADTKIISQIFQKKYEVPDILLPLVFATLTFYMGNFHRINNSMETPPTEDQINDIITSICGKIKQGLKFSVQEIDSIDFEKLEKLDESKIKNEKPEPLFKAVAEAVAEAGPWNASMELVAKKMGLSKSSLYGHFKDKKDMLRRLFFTEFKRIIDFARQGVSLSTNTAEQLYLGIYSVAVYLNSRPEILIAIDWIRTRRLDLGKPRTNGTDKNPEIFRLFEDIDIESLRGRSDEEKQLASGWILFILAGILSKTENHDAVFQNKTNIRVLYRFITLGLGGFIK